MMLLKLAWSYIWHSCELCFVNLSVLVNGIYESYRVNHVPFSSSHGANDHRSMLYLACSAGGIISSKNTRIRIFLT
jgi:hypothetical protein